MKIFSRRRKKWFIAILALVLFTQLISISGCMQMRTSQKKLYKKFEGKKHQPEFITYEVLDREMHYAEVGNADLPTVLMVHGAPGSLDAFLEYLKDDELLEKARLISVDRPGYGYSDFGKAEPSIERQAAMLKPILDKVYREDQPTILVGHSYGGPLIARMAMDYPDLVDGLVMIAPAIDPDNEKVFWISYPTHWWGLRWMMPKPIRVTNVEKFAHAGELQKMLPLWDSISCPITHLHGDKDWVVPAVNIEFTERVATNAPLQLLRDEEWDHFIVWSQMDTIKTLIIEHLDGKFEATQ